MSPIIYECTGKARKCKITYQDKFAKNNFTWKNRDNFAPSTCQNLLRFIRPKPNIKDLFGTFFFLSDLSPNIVFPCHLLLLAHSLRTVVETWLMWVWLMSSSYLMVLLGQSWQTPVHWNTTFWSWAFVKTRPKPAYGRQGLAESWGQDTDEVKQKPWKTMKPP